jgi:hypothetical protein
MKILFVYADSTDSWNSSEARTVIPSTAIVRRGIAEVRALHRSEWHLRDTKAMEFSEWADIIFFEREMIEFSLEMATVVTTALRKPVIVDFDDAHNLTPSNIYAYRFWKEDIINGYIDQQGKKVPVKASFPTLQQIKAGVTIGGILSSPSRLILKDWGNLPSLKLYIPNLINAWTYEKKSHPGFIIGWGGNMTHYDSMVSSGALEALERMMLKYPDIAFASYSSNFDIFHKLRERLPIERVHSQGWVKREEWAKRMTSFDLFIAPLAGQYDRRRSPLKVIDPVCAAIPTIASDYEPYEEFRGRSGIVLCSNGGSSWFRAMENAYKNYGKMLDAARNDQQEMISRYDATGNAEIFIDAYSQAIDYFKRKFK